MECKCKKEMIKKDNQYYLSNNYYQKYECPECLRTKVKVLDGYSSKKRVKV